MDGVGHVPLPELDVISNRGWHSLPLTGEQGALQASGTPNLHRDHERASRAAGPSAGANPSEPFDRPFVSCGIGYEPGLGGSTCPALPALFQPLRRRVQLGIERRFYRRRYNAARALEAFGAALHNEVEMAALGEQRVAISERTMEP